MMKFIMPSNSCFDHETCIYWTLYLSSGQKNVKENHKKLHTCVSVKIPRMLCETLPVMQNNHFYFEMGAVMVVIVW